MKRTIHQKIDGLGGHYHFLTPETIATHKAELKHIYDSITEALKQYPNFDGLDFCDVSAGGIQIRLHNKEISGYTFAGQPTIKYDFSNAEETISEAVQTWKDFDTVEHLKSFQHFLDWGSKYGFD